MLQTNERLSVLDISRPLIPCVMDETASHLSRMLKVNRTLVELNISKFGLHDLGLQLLCEELYRAGPSSALQVLHARSNKIQLVSDDSVAALARLLGSDTCRLNCLSIGANALRDEGALKLAEIVATNHSLLQLDVTSNAISSRGLCALGRSISGHPMLQDVSLWGNSFDSAACLAMQQALQMVKLDFTVQQVKQQVNGTYTYNCVRC